MLKLLLISRKTAKSESPLLVKKINPVKARNTPAITPLDGSNDIIAAKLYDPLWRLQKSYKPYEADLGVNKHEYDVNFHTNTTNYYNDSVYNGSTGTYTDNIPYSLQEYY